MLLLEGRMLHDKMMSVARRNDFTIEMMSEKCAMLIMKATEQGL